MESFVLALFKCQSAPQGVDMVRILAGQQDAHARGEVERENMLRAIERFPSTYAHLLPGVFVALEGV